MILENLLKPFFKDENSKIKHSIPSNDPSIDKTLSNDIDLDRYTLGYFDDNSTGLLFDRKEKASLINKQNDLIKRYRKVSMTPEVTSAIDEIINEMSFVVDNDEIVTLDVNTKAEMNDRLKTAFINNFEEILGLMNFSNNADSILKQFYTDGQVRFGCSYNNKSVKSGIAAIHILSPMNLYYNSEDKKWKYYTQNSSSYSVINNPKDIEEQGLTLTDEELVTIDSGLYSEGVILSHLHSVLKIANQLSSLEDMLIPLRFSRSVSRRVFNVDVGDLPYSKAMQAVKEIQDKFKYKKYYDVENGNISNSATTASIVEDYYFPNRGGKGTTVDVLDESGNLGETGDLEYFTRKLYSALKVPLGRISGSEKSTVYDFSGSQIEQDEIKFFAFINRLRQRFNNGFLEILKRHMVAKGLLTSSEFDEYRQYIIVRWERESNFLERQNIELLKAKLDLYAQTKDYIGDLYSRSWVLKNIMKMSEEEIEQMKKEMEVETLGDLSQTQPDMGDEVTDTEGGEDIGDEDINTDADADAEDVGDTEDVENDTEDSEEPSKAEKEFGGSFSKDMKK